MPLLENRRSSAYMSLLKDKQGMNSCGDLQRSPGRRRLFTRIRSSSHLDTKQSSPLRLQKGKSLQFGSVCEPYGSGSQPERTQEQPEEKRTSEVNTAKEKTGSSSNRCSLPVDVDTCTFTVKSSKRSELPRLRPPPTSKNNERPAYMRRSSTSTAWNSSCTLTTVEVSSTSSSSCGEFTTNFSTGATLDQSTEPKDGAIELEDVTPRKTNTVTAPQPMTLAADPHPMVPTVSPHLSERKTSKAVSNSDAQTNSLELDVLCQGLSLHDEDCDSMAVLDRLISETSERWQESARREPSTAPFLATNTCESLVPETQLQLPPPPPPILTDRQTPDHPQAAPENITSLVPATPQTRPQEQQLVPVANKSLVAVTSQEQQHQIVPRDTKNLVVVSPKGLNQDHREFWQQDIIARQQAEIEQLKILLQQQERQNVPPLHDYHYDVNEPNHPVEQIDDIPVEQIEVCDDHMSVTSGLTNLHPELMRANDESFSLEVNGPGGGLDFQTPVVGQTAPSRPDAASVTGTSLPPEQHSKHTSGMELELTAADGSKRHATYTGTTEGGKATGTGVLLFKETGDMYMGHVVDGRMHGQGTYTFKKKRTNQTCKVLKGMFEHNVFTGWDPDSLYWNTVPR